MQVLPYSQQNPLWPQAGRHILANFDDNSVCVYQAFQPATADWAVSHQSFGGSFSYSRMSWIKPNFLWMMYRCGWATKTGQERVLAIRISRAFFDELLRNGISSLYDSSQFPSHSDWQHTLTKSNIRLQWDPDHAPLGGPLERRAIQIGLRGEVLRRYGQIEPISIEDITIFVHEQSKNLQKPFSSLLIPVERVYVPEHQAAKNIGITIDP
jgi:hypothetical protein